HHRLRGGHVSSQRLAYEGHATAAYRLCNFLFMLMGVCCIYSLFNVISIVIKQVLNWLLGRMEAACHCCCGCLPGWGWGGWWCGAGWEVEEGPTAPTAPTATPGGTWWPGAPEGQGGSSP
ncbi:unnamed protein product, partial [Arctogadus glacialis]